VNGDITVGVIGELLGGWIAISLLHLDVGVNGINLESSLVAFLGAVVLPRDNTNAVLRRNLNEYTKFTSAGAWSKLILQFQSGAFAALTNH
jgi:hypothetical protein